jgi:hypothetical protein
MTTSISTTTGRADSHRAYRHGYVLDHMYHLLPRTWQTCHEELARPNLAPAWRVQVEQRLENICRGAG